MPLAAKDDPRNTPAMRQYQRFKQQHPDCVLLFRIGDFYECFDQDALTIHKALGVTLTQRMAGVPMAGVPHHAVESYLRRLIRAGFRVAVCDQVEDAALAKGLVQRDVTRVLTPGTLTDEALLEEGRENPLAAVMFHGAGEQGPGPGARRRGADSGSAASAAASLAWVELSTGAFHVATLGLDVLADEVARIGPRELLYVETANREPPERVRALTEPVHAAATPRPAWQFRLGEAVEVLRKQFQVATLAGFGLAEDDPALGCASAIVHYVLETQKTPQGQRIERIAHLAPPRRYERAEHLVLDSTSLRALEVERTTRSGSTQGSLLGVLQDCATAMGKRTLRQWLCFPLGKRAEIEARQDVVAALVADTRLVDRLRTVLEGVQDVERIVGRVSVARATPRDLTALGRSCTQAPKLAELLGGAAEGSPSSATLTPAEATTGASAAPGLRAQRDRLAPVAAELGQLGDTIARACVDSPPQHLREGGLFRDGFDAQLDEYRGLQRDSHAWLAAYQKRLIDETGIPSLKVGFNKVFGFYIELTAANRDKAPAAWSRKQTLKNAERFITQELKQYEERVLSAEQRAIAREQDLFARLGAAVQEHVPAVRTLGQTVAELDVLASFARRAVRRRYVRPRMVDQPILSIRAGRHPVLDEILGDRFVANDVQLGNMPDGQPLDGQGQGPSGEAGIVAPESGPAQDARARTLALITGPNMAGKSTFVRQAALIALMAHTGSFVPAEEAVVGVCDRIFTRVGASDELHAGASTFMVEMTETANICHHATEQSLVVLDEIGRGTSTLDGLSLAWAIAEHLAQRGCRTLFATHYHEITALAEELPSVANLHVTVREWQDQVVFLHRVAAGATDRSYGIHVAKIAGIPDPVIQRARQLLEQLEVHHHTESLAKTPRLPKTPRAQLSLFREYLQHPVVEALRKADLNHFSPIQAFEFLCKLKDDSERDIG